jgi:hypothetical protein
MNKIEYIFLGIEMILILPFLLSYSLLIDKIYGIKEAKKNGWKYGKIKWYYWIPFYMLFIY